MPRELVSPFSAAVGSHAGMSHNADGQCGCFDAKCPSSVGVVGGVRRAHLISGHDCFNVLAHAVGAARLGFVWPPINSTVRGANPHYELPRCAEIDAGAPYSRRACMGGQKAAKLKGGVRPQGGAKPSFFRSIAGRRLPTRAAGRPWKRRALRGVKP